MENNIIGYLTNKKFDCNVETISVSVNLNGKVIKAKKGKIFTVNLFVYMLEINDDSQIDQVIKYIESNSKSEDLNLAICTTQLQFNDDRCIYIGDNFSSTIHFIYLNTETNAKTYITDFHYHNSKYINEIIKEIVK